MRVLTVRQPWAWALIHGGKDVENRVRNIAGDYRGPVAIHAGLTWDGSPYDHPMIVEAHREARRLDNLSLVERDMQHMLPQTGHIIGVARLQNSHRAFGSNPGELNLCGHNGLCSPWAEKDVWHLSFTNPRALAEPIPFKGALGMRTLDDAVAAQIERQLATTAKEAER